MYCAKCNRKFKAEHIENGWYALVPGLPEVKVHPWCANAIRERFTMFIESAVGHDRGVCRVEGPTPKQAADRVLASNYLADLQRGGKKWWYLRDNLQQYMRYGPDGRLIPASEFDNHKKAWLKG